MFEVAVSVEDINEKETAYLDVRTNLGIDQDVFMDDVAGLGGHVQVGGDSLALFLPAAAFTM